MAAAQEVAREFAHQELGDLHLLYGILTTPDTIVIPMIQKVGARPDSLLADTQAALARLPQVTWNTPFKEVRGGATVDSQDPEAQFQAAKKYTVDLVERAQKGKLDPVIGRDEGKRSTNPILPLAPHRS